MHYRFLNVILAGVCLLQTPSFDQAHISFEITHMGVLNVDGTFNQIEGTFEKRDEVWVVEGHINVSSISTGNSSRDETLLTEQYLNAEAYPQIPFKAAINMKGKDLILSVEASIRGLPFAFETSLRLKHDQLVSAPIVIDRKAIGLDFGGMDTLIGDEITFIIHSGINPKELFEG